MTKTINRQKGDSFRWNIAARTRAVAFCNTTTPPYGVGSIHSCTGFYSVGVSRPSGELS
jgi:hypothetical protein